MAIVQLNKDYQEKLNEFKPGSGKLWSNKLTKPKAPKVSGLKERAMN